MYKLAVFVSGRGSNLHSITSKIENGYLEAEISLVISNKKDSKAIEYSKLNNLKTFIVSNLGAVENSINYAELTKELQNQKIDLIVLAGFLKKIPLDLIREFKNRIINIHPALLPSFGGMGMYGNNVHRAVFNSSAKVSGATVQFVDEIYDNGFIISQKAVDISDVKSPDEIAAKLLKLEHQLLPEVIKKFIDDKIKIFENRVFVD